MKILTFIVAFLFWSLAIFSQEKNDSSYDVHYILDATSDSLFFNEIYYSIDEVDKIFMSTCFYYMELIKEKNIFVDTFDLLTPKNYSLLESILTKRIDLYGFAKSSYFVPYFNFYNDTVELSAMNKILDNAKFNNKYSLHKNSNNIKRLHSSIKKSDSVLVESFLQFLPDSIIENETLYNLHKSMLLDTNYICNSILKKTRSNGRDLIIDFSFYEGVIYGKPKLNLWCSDYFNEKICFHVNLSKNNEIKNNKLRRVIRKHFDLKRKDIRRGGNYKMPNGNEVRIYNNNTN